MNVQPSQTLCLGFPTLCFVPQALHRFYGGRDLHFLTFSCYRRLPLFRNVTVCELFLHSLERVRPDFCAEFGSEWWNYIPRSRKYGETWGTQISVPLLYRCRVVTLLPDFGEVGT